MVEVVPEVVEERPDEEGAGHVRKIEANGSYWIEVCTELPGHDILIAGYHPCGADESIDDHAETVRRLRHDLADTW